jgi:hypothetical protein
LAAFGSCSAPANPIEAENCLPGNPSSQWDIYGNGDPTIQGFATDISVNVGQTINFKIETSASAYTIEIYRMGYYGGMGARLITTLRPSVTLPQSQPACMTDSTTGLVDCGNWAVSASWQVPSNATSGIYFAHLVRNDTGGDSHIVFVVRTDAGHSAILFQTADETWQAYNGYGGNSLYGPTNGFDLTNRAYKVSYNRPSDTRGFGDEAVTWVFGAEYPMVRWLEANGYDVAYFTGVDAARNGSLIQNHKLYLSVGHDEYWTGPHRTNVEAARDAGVNMAFFSGNEVFWKTRWENSIDGTNTSYRTLVCYKETLGPNSNPTATAAVDPLDPPTWTGTWRDTSKSPPADGGRPENSLTGTIFMVNGLGTDNPGNLSIQVPAADGKMRFWRNTTLANLAAGQAGTLPAGTLGYEWDEDLDNGARPAGTFDVSTATYNLTADFLQDQGGVYGAGTATHHMTLHRASSGALVFGAGTIQWSWGLDSTHDNPFNFASPAADPDMQQATLNLFADMGVQPATLQAGLVPATASTDTVPPISTITSPANGSNLTSGGIITIQGTATDAGGGVVGGVEVSVDGGTTWHPATGRGNWTFAWGPNSPGTATIKTRAVDDSGNIETPGAGVSVTVQGETDMWSSTTTPQIVDSGDGSAVELGVKFTSSENGFINGIRFYKSAANTGTHIGNLWRASGTLLASATFTGETASGWQQVNFSSPVPITAGATYVASYYAPRGHYSATDGFFATSGSTNPPLTFLANSVSPNGVFIYSSASAFPTSSSGASNYWVDIGFTTTVTVSSGPAVTTVSPTNGATGILVASSVSATFNESMNPVTINGNTFTLSSPAGTIAATVSYNSSTLSATLVPSQALAYSTTYTATIDGGANGVQDPNGKLLSANYSWTFTTMPPPGTCPCSIWNYTATPGTVDSGDKSGVELGVKFTANEAGFITGIRFYKSAANTGTHIGNLWTTGGALLATATFTGESASGWQQVNFSKPVEITAGTTYAASYYAPAGHYSFDSGYFGTAGVNNPPLQALANSVTPNGVYAYSSASTFPSSTYGATNYWVDVVFATTVTVSSGPAVVSATPASGATGVPVGTSVTATFNESMNAATLNSNTFQLSSQGTTIPATVSYNSSTLTATLVPSQPLTFLTTYTVTLVGGANGVQDPNGGLLSANDVWTFTTGTCPCSIWTSSATPSIVDSGDPSGVEVGVKFTANENGFITGVRFYKSAANTGTHIGNLWTTAGTLLATAIFTGESASGWQQVNFSSPVAVTAGTTYVASYYAPAGHYSFDSGFFSAAGVNSPPLQALANSVSPNGVYAYGSTTGFPELSYNATNYWVDVVFATTVTTSSGPAVTTVSPANAATGVPIVTSVTASFNESMNATTINGNTFQLSSQGTTVAATVSYNSSTLTATLTPSQPLAYSTTYTATVAGGSSGVKDNSGNQLSVNYAWTFTTMPSPGNCPCSIWSFAATPGTVDSGDPNGIELGVKFTANENGYITGIRFYKSAANTGTHIGNLWTTAGALLATGTFTGESASGWQQVNFSSPVAVTAGTTYVASYYAPAGHYSFDSGFFSTAGVNNPPLQALANSLSSDGVYIYSSSSSFPTFSYNATNYWVDVVFNTVP